MSDDPTLSTETASKVFPPLILHAEGFTLMITPLSPYRDPICHKIFFNGTVSVNTEIPTNKHCIETFMECYLSDLERLREDIEVHVHRLAQRPPVDWNDRASAEKHIDLILTGPSIESPTWVPLELELQITCLDGEVSYEEDILTGEFSIRVMVHVPERLEANTEQRRIYVGCEGSVDIQEVQSFCAALRSCIVHYEKL